jgi:hypothetical protein
MRTKRIVVILLAVPMGGRLALAQPGQTQPAATQPATALKAQVVEVSGRVDQAPTGIGALDDAAWKPVQVGQDLASGTQIRTGLRSYCVLLFGDDTVVSIRRATLASIDQFHQTATTKTVRLGLGYGAVRGGTTEGTLRSEVVVDSPVATLAKRGTEGWEMEVEPYTGRFRISLARSGLIEALQKLTGQRRLVRAGQYADHLNIARAWIQQATFDRAVRLVSADSITPADLDFSTRVTTGSATVAPGGGAQLPGLAGRRTAPIRFDQGIRAENLPDLIRRIRSLLPINTRPEGNFGVP